MRPLAITLVLATGCATSPQGAVEVDPDEAGDIDEGKGDSATGLPEVWCAADPGTAGREGFRHTSSKITAAIADSRHRGVDLVATATGSQVIAGDASYGTLDKALEDEDVEIFACRAHQWKKLGRARTDDEGHFSLTLEGEKRLPLGVRDLYLSIAGDRTGVRFLGLVAPEGTALAVTDVDGTLTSSENAFGATIILGIDVDMHANAKAAFDTIAARGYQPIYVTARSRAWTEVTRQWLAEKGMPRGPLRLSPKTILPGGSTVEFKTEALRSLEGYELALGNGNRESDLDAYANAGIPADRRFIKLPEFSDEVGARLEAGDAIGFTDYSELQRIASQLPPR